ncbi:MAG: flavodoxin-dependent (E)-4-hydroxy-3-methylbut-2-enyl-diphosphate synthase [Calditrichaeota bacterium]|nr:flavodoxin-dependent (E)-4-hydroxy-3-methylbut-2-enyl-diphosphate synthase [Calditrichota bacterium]
MDAKNSQSETFHIKRRISREVKIGNIAIGGNSPITIQSMTNTKTTDVAATVRQIFQLEEAGCDIVRVAVPNEKAAQAIAGIKSQIHIPLVADIHFNYKLALQSIASGADKIRINPGNIGSEEKIRQVLDKANEHSIPMRIGVNAGSLEKDLIDKYSQPCADAMVESAMRHVELCEKYNFSNVIVALKASDVLMMIEANQKFAALTDYPLHLGVTEAGTKDIGLVKSAIGIGTLLRQGIGDTIRVSLTANPVEEIKAGLNILKALKLKRRGITLISCPTCGRLEYDLFKIIDEFEAKTEHIKKPVTVAIMGCVVNGPGEAREADIGIAGGKGKVVLFKKGQVIKTIPESKVIEVLLEEIEKI